MALVNGKPYTIEDGTSMADLIKQLNIAGGRIAVEVNGRVIPRSDFEKRIIKPDDTVEIVSFVGGG